MGFYQDNSKQPKSGSGRVGSWLAVVAASALVGAGSTLALTPYVQSHLTANTTSSTPSTTVASTTAATPTSVNPSQVIDLSVNSSITQVYKQASKFVVAVVNYQSVNDYYTQASQLQQYGVGSGVLIYKDSNYGYLVTNNHVVEGASKLEVVLSTGRHVQAQLVGSDPYTDLAVVKVPVAQVKGVTPAQFANSTNLQVGEPAIAIGTPLGLDFAESVTAGIVSGPQRMMPVQEPTTQQTLDYEPVIQTDASINPGNSGGPLLNIDGQVIGINSSKIAQTDVQGMGFAIPSNLVQQISSEIMKTGHATHAALGVQGYELDAVPQQFWPNNVPVDYGFLVQSVTSTEAKSAGLKAGDVIVSFNGQTIQTMADLRTALFQTNPGNTVTVGVYRGSQLLKLKVKVTTMTTSASTGSTSQAPNISGGSAGGLFGGSDGSSSGGGFFGGSNGSAGSIFGGGSGTGSTSAS